MSSKLILTILSYTVSKLVCFLRHSAVIRRLWWWIYNGSISNYNGSIQSGNIIFTISFNCCYNTKVSWTNWQRVWDYGWIWLDRIAILTSHLAFINEWMQTCDKNHHNFTEKETIIHNFFLIMDNNTTVIVWTNAQTKSCVMTNHRRRVLHATRHSPDTQLDYV